MTENSSSQGRDLPEVNAGYIPLIDSAVLVAAKELGQDVAHGFRLNLHREVSWANIRDKVNVGIYDCAHMLAPMPIAASLGLGHVKEPIIAPFVMNLNGNAITVSNELFAHMMDLNPEAAPAGGMHAAKAIAEVVKERAAKGQEPLAFGTVFPFSCHTFQLYYWLAAAGVNPVEDIKTIVIPPPLIAASLKAGHINGFCAGAPWPSVSVIEGAGRIVATSNELWNGSTEKVLGVRLAWVERNQDLHVNLLRALSETARWLDEKPNRHQAAEMLSQPQYLDLPVDVLERPLLGTLQRDKNGDFKDENDFVVFYKNNANFPWRSHALWFLTQMVRWGQLTEPFDLRQVADFIYRPDIYRTALRDVEQDIPTSDFAAIQPNVIEGAEGASGFFSERVFDSSDLLNYMENQAIYAPGVDLAGLAKINR